MKLQQRLSPSGPVLGEFGVGSGFIVQALTLDTIVTVGALAVAAQEIQVDMSVPASNHSMRPSLTQFSKKNYVQVETGFDIRLADTWVTSTITTAIQLSRDQLTWFGAWSTTQDWGDVNPTTARSQRGHIQLKTPHLDPVIIAGLLDVDTIYARVMISSPATPGRATVVSEGASGSAYCTLYELLHVV